MWDSFKDINKTLETLGAAAEQLSASVIEVKASDIPPASTSRGSSKQEGPNDGVGEDDKGEKIAALEEKIVELKQTLAESEAGAQIEIDELKAEVATRQRQQKRAEADLGKLASQNIKLDARLKDMEGELAASQESEREMALEKQVRQLERELQRMEVQLAESNTALEKAQSDARAGEMRAAQIASTSEKREASEKELKGELEEALKRAVDAEREALMRKASVVGEEETVLATKEEGGVEATSAATRLEELERENGRLVSLTEEREATNEELRLSVDSLKDQVRQGELAKLEAETCKIERAKALEGAEMAKAAMEEALASHSEIQQEITRLRNTEEERKRRFQLVQRNYEEKITSLEHKLVTLEEERDTKSVSEESLQEMQRQGTEIERLRVALESAEARLHKSIIERSGLEENLKVALYERSRLEAELDATRSLTTDFPVFKGPSSKANEEIAKQKALQDEAHAKHVEETLASLSVELRAVVAPDTIGQPHSDDAVSGDALEDFAALVHNAVGRIRELSLNGEAGVHYPLGASPFKNEQVSKAMDDAEARVFAAEIASSKAETRARDAETTAKMLREQLTTAEKNIKDLGWQVKMAASNQAKAAAQPSSSNSIFDWWNCTAKK